MEKDEVIDMRLIDADRLLTDRMKSKYYHLPNGDIAIPLIDIEHAPTIAPVRKGKWIKISPAGVYECSVCGLNLMTGDIDVYSWCHGCGAKMEEPEDIPMEYFESGGR